MSLCTTYLFITHGIIYEFELPDGSYSVSNIQDYIKYMIKKHEKLTKIPPIDL